MYPWAYTWNPLGGKCPHQCSYCYVDRLKNIGLKKYMEDPFLDEKAFHDKLVVPEGFIVFVQSCGDLFAYGIPETWIWRVLNYISKFSQTTFLLQTKNPERFFDFNIPQNCILGTTIETNREGLYSTHARPIKERYFVFNMLNHDRDIEGNKIYRLMISLEPILKFDLSILSSWIKDIEPEFVSIGADSQKHHLPEPNKEELSNLISTLKDFTEVKLKKNLNRLME
jgi:DNA repair photolyase